MDGVDLTADLTQAVRRAETKQRIAGLLGALTTSDRRAVLLDLLAEQDASAAPRPQATTPPAAASVRRRGGRPKKKAKSNGAGGAPQGRTEILIATLAPQPGLPIKAMSSAVYGDDSEANRNKTRSLLNALKKQGRVKSVAPGQWEVVA